MDTENDFAQLVRQAQLGDRISLDRLAEGARQRLYAYIYRLTLNHDLAQDLLQETLLKMVENIKELEHPERFWSWLFRTAMGIVQHYYRDLAQGTGDRVFVGQSQTSVAVPLRGRRRRPQPRHPQRTLRDDRRCDGAVAADPPQRPDAAVLRANVVRGDRRGDGLQGAAGAGAVLQGQALAEPAVVPAGARQGSAGHGPGRLRAADRPRRQRLGKYGHRRVTERRPRRRHRRQGRDALRRGDWP